MNAASVTLCPDCSAPMTLADHQVMALGGDGDEEDDSAFQRERERSLYVCPCGVQAWVVGGEVAVWMSESNLSVRVRRET